MADELITGYTNASIASKIDSEGLEYFFASYLDSSNIINKELATAVEQLRDAIDAIETVLDEYGVFDDED